jgi:hypothetical protein
MVRFKLDVCVLWILILAATFFFSNGCYVNDCICLNDQVICAENDQARPRFTTGERFATRKLYLSGTQSLWLQARVCDIFPRISEIILMDGTLCPRIRCAMCR